MIWCAFGKLFPDPGSSVGEELGSSTNIANFCRKVSKSKNGPRMIRLLLGVAAILAVSSIPSARALESVSSTNTVLDEAKDAAESVSIISMKVDSMINALPHQQLDEVKQFPPRSLRKCKDSKDRFNISSMGKLRSCTWASNTDTQSRCELEEVKDNCPVLCQMCSSNGKGKGKGKTAQPSTNPSVSPSMLPSHAPSVSPSSSPTSTPSVSPSSSPTSNPSASPSSLPTSNPSVSPTSNPSAFPSSQPSECVDEEEWTMPGDSIWKKKGFSGKTCAELEAYVTPDQYNEWCSFLSQGVHSTKVPLEACCFCGGGDLIEPTCKDLQWTVLEGSNIDCAFVERSSNSTRFCEDFGDDNFSADGLSLKDACCVCDGGSIVYESSRSGNGMDKKTERKLNDFVIEDDGSSEGANASSPNTNPSYRDYIFREGAGDSPGIPNLEYLGIGYHTLFGNPRGAVDTELDPGFRHRVLRLRQQQSDLTVDTNFMVPLGTEVKYTSSCKFDEKSREISSDKDVRRSLSEEASFGESSSSSAGFGASTLFSSFTASMSASHAFSKSSRFQSTTSTSVSTNTVSFEARAVCSEYEASFSPYADHELDPMFKKALKTLPVPFDDNNPIDRAAYERFFTVYGTNYVRHVILGGKRIYTHSMTSETYSKLVQQSVEVESTLSYDMAAAMGASQQVNAAQVKAAASLATKFGGPKGAAIGSFVNVALDTAGVEDNDVLFSRDVELATSYSLAQHASNKKQAEDSIEISNVNTDCSEVTIGGLPEIDWRSWAATVQDRPMPIRYELGNLMEFMTYEQSVSFIGAFESLYGIDLSKQTTNTILNDALHFGVCGGGGEPLAASSTNPNASYRALVQVDEIISAEKTRKSTSTLEVYDVGAAYPQSFDNKVEADDNMYACGVKTHAETLDSLDAEGTDEMGIGRIDLKFCNKLNWDEQSPFQKLSEGYDDDDIIEEEKMCEKDSYIVGMQVRYCGLGKDDINGCKNGINANGSQDYLGIHGLYIICRRWDGTNQRKESVHCRSRAGEGNKEGGECGQIGTWEDEKLIEVPDDDSGDSYGIIGGQTRQGPISLIRDDVGLIGIRLITEKVELPSDDDGPKRDIVTYSAVWRGKIKRPTAVFATKIRLDIVRDKEEESQFGFVSETFGKQTLDYRNNIPFSISETTNAPGSIAVTNFGKELDRSTLQSFSFLTAENLMQYHGQITTGIIRYDGVTLNKRSGIDVGFEVEKDENRRFLINLTNNTIHQHTVVAFPTWSSIDGRFYPTDASEVVNAISSINNNNFAVSYGKTSGDRSYMGLNFLALDPKLPTENVKHGTIVTCAETDINIIPSDRMHGLKMTSCDKGDHVTSPLDGHGGGVLIHFDEPFESYPSVILTPIFTGAISNDAVPRCIVESLTVKSVYVKCGVIKNGNEYVWVPFTIVAVGPHV